jgi:soluble cytochrome b562
VSSGDQWSPDFARLEELEKYKSAFENLVARIDRDGGHAQAGKTLEENFKRADAKVVELLSTYEMLVGKGP